MKKIYSFTLFLVFSLSFLLAASSSRAQGSVSFQVFYDQLTPYGSWVNYHQYGYVWIPTSVAHGFRPYGSSGHWVFTPDGWTWVSDYNWGWAPFHYGNWFYDDSYGWMWAPGYEWAPAWVTWGEYGGNYCWAPIGPHIQIGVSWNSYRPPAYCWTFVPRAYINRPNINNYYVHYNRNVTVVNNITVINNINSGGGGRPQYMRGPRPDHVERYTHTAIRPVAVRESSRPGRGQVQNGQLAIYRPTVNRAPAGRPAAPARVQQLQAIKPTKLPGYNPNVRPATESRPARPVQSENKPTERPVRPSHPESRPVERLTRQTHTAAAPQQQISRPETRQTPRPIPQSARPAQPEGRRPMERPVPQPRPASSPQQQTPRPETHQQPQARPQPSRPVQPVSRPAERPER